MIMATSTLTNGSGVFPNERPSLRAQSLDGITRRYRVEPPRKRDGITSTIDLVPVDPDPDAPVVPGSKFTNAEFAEVVTQLKAINDRAAERERHESPAPGELPELARVRRNYFDETPAERRARQDRAKAERVAEREEQTAELLANDDRESLFHLYHFLVRFFARKLQVSLEFDDFTRDDVEQAGSIGLWMAAQQFREEMDIPFAGYASKCIHNEMWKEFSRRRQQQKRGFRQHSEQELIESGRPVIEQEMEETELIGVIERKLLELPDNARVILSLRTSGDTVAAVAKILGVAGSAVHRKYYWALEEMREMILPLIIGAWHPSPCFLSDVWADIRHAQKRHSQPVEQPKIERFCEHCGESIALKQKGARYCGNTCAAAVYRARLKAK